MIFDLQKADLWKRISAGLFDLIMIVIIAVGLCWCISEIVDYDQYVEGLNDCYERYEEEYGIDLEKLSNGEYEKLPDAEKEKYKKADEAFSKDEEAAYYTNMMYNLLLVMVVISVLIANTIMEFVIPLILKNGQTLGKKIFGIGVMRYDGVRVSPLLMFVRSILGKCTIETLIPLFLVFLLLIGSGGLFSIIGLALIVIGQIVLTFVTYERTLIHDIMGQTCVIDMKSQLIFETPEALMEYKQKKQAEKAANSSYF